MKIYTKTGDDGTTGLIGGGRVRKSDPRLSCYGTVDELNAHVGLAMCSAPTRIADFLEEVQHYLFVIGSHLATPADSPHIIDLPLLSNDPISRLEAQIDEAEHALSPLQVFILPGGSEPAARLHVARTVCRRAERLLVDLAADQPVSPLILMYLNRLSDWLFVQARMANQLLSAREIAWRK